MFLGDFHIHSNFSDGKLSIPELVDLIRVTGLRGNCHHRSPLRVRDDSGESLRVSRLLTYGGELSSLYVEILKSEAERAWDLYRMVVIPGVELTKNSINNHRSAHVLALGVNTLLSADGDIADIARGIRATGGLGGRSPPGLDAEDGEADLSHLGQTP